MTRIEFAPEVFDDFDRFFDYIAQFDAGSTPERIEEILEAVQILTTSPLIGRPVRGGKRELVIGRGSRGYVALYRYVAQIDTVFVLAMRSQRDAREYDEFLSRKVDVARSSMRAGLGRSNDEVEAEFAARRASTASIPSLDGQGRFPAPAN